MKFYRSITSLIFLILFVSAAQGQWKMLRDFGAQIYSIHFLDREGFPQIGFVGLTNGEIWRTADGGTTWQKTNTRPNLIAPIRDFSFKDSLTGWLCQSQTMGYPCVYMTTDAGITWNPLTPTGQGMGIYYNLYSHALILSQWQNGSVSTDFGTTWANTGNNSNMCGIAFTDSIHGLATTYPTGGYSSTTDGGLTWQGLAQAVEAWQPLAIKGTRTYFICGEGARQIQRSDDDAKTWRLIHQFPATLDLTGDIRGDLSAMYVQSKSGTFYSIDQGVTWTDYCGPKNDFDTRFYNIGSDTVYAGTLDGKLWLNPFGVKKNNLLLQFPKVFDLTSQGCLNVDSLFRFIDLSNCLAVKLLDIQIVSGPGSKTFSFKTPIFPVTLDSNGDSVKVTYTPDNSAADSAQLFIKYSVGGEIFQSFVKLRGFVKPGFNVTLSKDLNLLLSSDCSKIDTFVTIKSGQCAADTLIAATLSDPTAFTITPPPLPAGIPAGSSLKIPVSVKSLAAGSYSAILTLTIRSGGITRDTVIKLSALILSASEPRTNLTPALAKFDTVSICALAIDTIVIKNTICKNLFIKAAAILPAAAAAQYSYSILHKSIVDTLVPKEADTILIQYKPTVGGLISGNLILTIGFDLVTTRDTSIPISGIGKALAGSALETSLLHFADTVPCSMQELSTHLYNNSCGYDTIVSIIPTKDNSFSVLSPTPPTTISSGDSILIKIQEDPLSPGAKFDSVRAVIHSSTGAIDTVTLKVSGIVNKPVHMLSLLSLLQLDSLAPCTPIDTTLQIKNLGTCDTIIINTIDLTGANWITLVKSTLPAKILPGGSFSYTLHLTPGAKTNGTTQIHIVGIGIDTLITVRANSRVGGSILTVTADSIFASSFCKLATHTFTLQNTSCDPIVFDALSLKNILGNQFTFTPNISLPLTIQPGGKQDIIITFDPSAIGDSLATFSYTSTISGISRSISLKGTLSTTKQTAHLELFIAPNLKLITLQAQAIVNVRLVLQDNIDPSLGLQSVTATLGYLDDVLGIPNATASPGWKLNSITPTKGNLSLDLSRTDNNPITAGMEIATVQFQTYIAKSASTLLGIQTVTLNGGDLVFQSCVLSPMSLAPVTITVAECGSDVLRSYLNDPNTIFTNISIRPNPVSSGAQINVSFQLNQQSDMNITLRDALGRTVSHSTKYFPAKGAQDIALYLPKGTSGIYILSLEAGGMRESRKIVIEE